MSVAPTIKGWCPGAYRPMMSVDGLVVRIRPHLGRLSRAQMIGLCDLAVAFGSGHLDLTNRANLQIRGVTEAGFEPLLQHLAALEVLDHDPALESRRNILVTPFWVPGDGVIDLTRRLGAHLVNLPELPAKTGFVIDGADQRVLGEAPGDFRVERSARGLILRADGARRGRPITPETFLGALDQMVAWFHDRITPETRRMARVLEHHQLPEDWCTVAPFAASPAPHVGVVAGGKLLGAPFGQIDARAFGALLKTSTTQAIRVTPWRAFLLEGVRELETDAFITDPHDPLLRVDACPGAPFCPSASVETKRIARAMAARTTGRLHVSGCAKGCARPGPADLTLIGNDGRFDLVTRGRAGDTPEKTGLSAQDLMAGDY